MAVKKDTFNVTTINTQDHRMTAVASGPDGADKLSQTCGYVPDGERGVPDEYLVKIIVSGGKKSDPQKSGTTSPIKQVIVGVLQSSIDMAITAEWESAIPSEYLGALGGVANIATQGLGGFSLQTCLTSRRIWKGTSPVGMNVSLKFQAVNDDDESTYEEVVQPIQYLQMIASPRTQNVGGYQVP